MNNTILKFWYWYQGLNGYRITFIVITAYFAIAGYVGGWFNSLLIAGVFGALYQLGYHSALRDLVNKAEEK